jgi:hypothetical protein
MPTPTPRSAAASPAALVPVLAAGSRLPPPLRTPAAAGCWPTRRCPPTRSRPDRRGRAHRPAVPRPAGPGFSALHRLPDGSYLGHARQRFRCVGEQRRLRLRVYRLRLVALRAGGGAGQVDVLGYTELHDPTGGSPSQQRLLHPRQTNALRLSPVSVAFARGVGLPNGAYTKPTLAQLFDFADFYARWYAAGRGRTAAKARNAARCDSTSRPRSIHAPSSRSVRSAQTVSRPRWLG